MVASAGFPDTWKLPEGWPHSLGVTQEDYCPSPSRPLLYLHFLSTCCVPGPQVDRHSLSQKRLVGLEA